MTARQFVKYGPSIPAEVLYALEEGTLVFFCGAGISKGTGLPDFAGLVADVRAACYPTADEAVEDAACHAQYDKALEVIERAEGDRRGSMRRAVMRRLLATPEGDVKLELHQALLTLAKRKGRPGSGVGYRLVTTNFDDRFQEAGLQPEWIEQGPRLRRPRPDTLNRVVYLHGRIERELPESQRDLFELVLTSADFGNACLREGWAARFVIELFREFTVLFVGYGLNDPVMRYLMDAFATESRPGGQFKPAYALASYKAAKENDRERQQRLWEAKNVRPILYAADLLQRNARIAGRSGAISGSLYTRFLNHRRTCFLSWRASSRWPRSTKWL
jgi:hypothetical protein